MNLSKWNYNFAVENPIYFAHLLLSYYKNMLQSTVDEEKFIAEKLSVPAPLPRILKEFTKAAIRTQPYDLLRWSVSYFQALANGEEPPVKERLEFPPLETDSGLTPGYLKILHRQLGDQYNNKEISIKQLQSKWSDICLKESSLSEMLELLNLNINDSTCTITWLNFLAIAAGYITQSPLQTMVQICETLTQEPEGASACIPLNIFESSYILISSTNAPNIVGIGPAVHIDLQKNFIQYIKEVAVEQAGNITPRNLAHYNCPKLY